MGRVVVGGVERGGEREREREREREGERKRERERERERLRESGRARMERESDNATLLQSEKEGKTGRVKCAYEEVNVVFLAVFFECFLQS